MAFRSVRPVRPVPAALVVLVCACCAAEIAFRWSALCSTLLLILSLGLCALYVLCETALDIATLFAPPRPDNDNDYPRLAG